SFSGEVGSEEARRRIKFFLNSLLISAPKPQPVAGMPSWSTLTPYYSEDVVLPLESLKEETQDGVSVLEYLRSIYSNEWEYLVEVRHLTRLGREFDAGPAVLNEIKRVLQAPAGKNNYFDKSNDMKSNQIKSRPPHTSVDAPKLALAAKKVMRQISNEKTADAADEVLAQIQLWASYRAQTLARTARGMMHYGEAVRLLSAVEGELFQQVDIEVPNRASCESESEVFCRSANCLSTGILKAAMPHMSPSLFVQMFSRFLVQDPLTHLALESRLLSQPLPCLKYDHTCCTQQTGGHGNISVNDVGLDKSSQEYHASYALSDAKYRYIVSCQIFSKMRKSNREADQAKARAIEKLAKKHRGLRIACVEERDSCHFSQLYVWSHEEDSLVKEFEIELPGHILVGEGKPNNQNHAIIFTRGEAVQAIDMNQDGALEDALKQRQLLEEFGFGTGSSQGRIVGFREHVFTHNVSSIAGFFSLQELNFVTATQRVLDQPLAVRFHYGHPDLFDRVTAITGGGISKASKGIHLSEDIFAGFNWVLRGGASSQADYMQVGKGRDTGVSQITGFTAKISMGNGMQARSREVARLASQLDFFRLLSFFYSSVGGFQMQCLLILAIFLYMYCKVSQTVVLYLRSSSISTVLSTAASAISSEFLLQLGFLLIVPIPLVVTVESGVVKALTTFISLLVKLSPFFFVFSTGTTGHYVNAAITQGKAVYKATGRGFVIAHEGFVPGFRSFFFSHFYPAAELLVLLLLYAKFTIFTSTYALETFSVWLLVVGWLYSPSMFNPNGLDTSSASSDFNEWLAWMLSKSQGPESSWTAWYTLHVENTRKTMQFRKKCQVSLMNLRFLILTWGMLEAFREGETYRLGVAGMIALLLLLAICVTALTLRGLTELNRAGKLLAAGSRGGRTLNRRFKRMAVCFTVLVVLALLVILPTTGTASIGQIFYMLLAQLFAMYFVSTIVAVWMPSSVTEVGLVKNAALVVHLCTGMVIQLPILFLSFFPFMSDLQTRMLFNEDFSHRFNI
ncbi:unnamed protein product, partial [Chrysoparadoxa australica]